MKHHNTRAIPISVITVLLLLFFIITQPLAAKEVSAAEPANTTGNRISAFAPADTPGGMPLLSARTRNTTSESVESAGDVSAGEPHLIGIRVAPPFVMEEPDGTYSGLTIDLWDHIATELNLEYEFVERDIQGLIDGVSHADDDGRTELFAAASALTITSEREELLDFTHPFYVSGLGIAVTYTPSGFGQAFFAIFSTEFLWVVALLVLLLLFWGVLVWWGERKHNPDQFGGTAGEGIGSGFWWAAVTMTTVGYGDKAPVTLPGRLIGFVWMFAGIILISFFTASIASSLTVSQLDSRVSGPQDLPHVRVGALEHSATLIYLDETRIRYREYGSITDGLRAVADDEIDAFVHDAPIIRYYATGEFPGEVRIMPQTFNEQYYGIALPLNSPWRNDINRVMLEYIAGDEWESLLGRYLGK